MFLKKKLNDFGQSEIYKLGVGFDFNFADSWNVNSKMLRKIKKDSGHKNTFILKTFLAFKWFF